MILPWEVLPSEPPWLDTTAVDAEDSPAWAVALVMWSGSMVLAAVAVWRAATIILRTGPETRDEDPHESDHDAESRH